MSLELLPVTIKISPETMAMLKAESAITGAHVNAIARQILAVWSERQIHNSNVRHKFLVSEGFKGIDGDVSVVAGSCDE